MIKKFLKYGGYIVQLVILQVVDTIYLGILSKRAPTKKGTLLIVRLDAIGDYMLFRNFLKTFRESKQFSGYHITLCGNIAWKNLAENLDISMVDDFLWIDRKKFGKNILYRLSILRSIRQCGSEIAIQPTYSREYLVGDTIIRASNASERIGSSGDISNMHPLQKKISDKWYTKLISAKNCVMFEFIRNQEFFENLTHSKNLITKPELHIHERNTTLNLPEDYVVFFPGANAIFRQWSTKNFSIIANFIWKNYKLPIVIGGSKNEHILAKEIINLSNGVIVDITGKTSLYEFTKVLHSAHLLISNDTSAIHIGASLGIKCICISNGNHYSRFVPYPKDMVNDFFTILPTKIQENSDIQYLIDTYGKGSNININLISPEQVQQLIMTIL